MRAIDAGLFGNGLSSWLLPGRVAAFEHCAMPGATLPMPDASQLAVNCVFAGRTAEILIAVRLAQLDAEPLGELHQFLTDPMHQLGVCR
jgi:hypothetical protein